MFQKISFTILSYRYLVSISILLSLISLSLCVFTPYLSTYSSSCFIFASVVFLTRLGDLSIACALTLFFFTLIAREPRVVLARAEHKQPRYEKANRSLRNESSRFSFASVEAQVKMPIVQEGSADFRKGLCCPSLKQRHLNQSLTCSAFLGEPLTA